jgi:hypothetical protein
MWRGICSARPSTESSILPGTEALEHITHVYGVPVDSVQVYAPQLLCPGLAKPMVAQAVHKRSGQLVSPAGANDSYTPDPLVYHIWRKACQTGDLTPMEKVPCARPQKQGGVVLAPEASLSHSGIGTHLSLKQCFLFDTDNIAHFVVLNCNPPFTTIHRTPPLLSVWCNGGMARGQPTQGRWTLRSTGAPW